MRRKSFQVLGRVDHPAVLFDCKVKMGLCAIACAADLADFLTDSNGRAGFEIFRQRAQMIVGRFNAVRVTEDHIVPCRAVSPHSGDHASLRGVDRRSRRRFEIDSQMRLHLAGDGMAAAFLKKTGDADITDRSVKRTIAQKVFRIHENAAFGHADEVLADLFAAQFQGGLQHFAVTHEVWSVVLLFELQPEGRSGGNPLEIMFKNVGVHESRGDPVGFHLRKNAGHQGSANFAFDQLNFRQVLGGRRFDGKAVRRFLDVENQVLFVIVHAKRRFPVGGRQEIAHLRREEERVKSLGRAQHLFALFEGKAMAAKDGDDRVAEADFLGRK